MNGADTVPTSHSYNVAIVEDTQWLSILHVALFKRYLTKLGRLLSATFIIVAESRKRQMDIQATQVTESTQFYLLKLTRFYVDKTFFFVILSVSTANQPKLDFI